MNATYGETPAMPCAYSHCNGGRKSKGFNVCEVETLKGVSGVLFLGTLVNSRRLWSRETVVTGTGFDGFEV